MKSIIAWIVASITAQWGREECAVSTGAFGKFAYKYYAVGSSSDPCATSSQLGRIEESLYHSIQKLDLDTLPDSTCMPVDFDGQWNNGAWKGYLLYGPLGKVQLDEYCGPSLKPELKLTSTDSIKEL
ncbi:hypothetical protein D6C95_07714 [Aureobasidium pullulans]|nr:hypothetical protein D6C95_07714 [Aureobasidium pullulans]